MKKLHIIRIFSVSDALPLLHPLRTACESFPSSSSSRYQALRKREAATRPCESRLAGDGDQTIGESSVPFGVKRPV
jgi:hypothetical protein